MRLEHLIFALLRAFASMRKDKSCVFLESCDGHDSKNENNLERIDMNANLKRGPFYFRRTLFHAQVCCLARSETPFLLKLIQKYDVAQFLVDIIICVPASYFPSFHANKSTVHEVNILSSPLLRRLLLIVDHDPTVNVYRYFLHSHVSSKNSEKETNAYGKTILIYVEFLLQRCASVSAQGRLEALDVSTLTRHSIHLYLSGTKNFRKWSFKLRSWVAISDIVDCSFIALSGGEYSLETILALRNALSNDSHNCNRSAEVDYMFISHFSAGN